MAITKMTAGETVRFDNERTEVIAPPCANKTNGYWYCTTCKESINPNFAPAKHERGNHKMLWMCYEHGPEQP